MTVLEKQILMFILSMIPLIALAVFFGKRVYKQIKQLLLIHKANKAYKKMMGEVKKFKEDGNMHEWVDMAVMHPTKGMINTHVCKKTGYVPSIDGFVPMTQVKAILRQREEMEEYEDFKKKRISEITERYNLPCIEVANELVKEIQSFKKDFATGKMQDFINEVKAKTGKDIKVVSSEKELIEHLTKKD